VQGNEHGDVAQWCDVGERVVIAPNRAFPHPLLRLA